MSTKDPQGMKAAFDELTRAAEGSGYHLNPDTAFVSELVDGLLTNNARYGYQSCPCRLSSGDAAKDVDIVCPCDYRDDDIVEHGACYCALYVSEEVARGEKAARPIRDRRARSSAAPPAVGSSGPTQPATLPYPVWRCKVCGYLCARNAPPGTCPICKVEHRFEKFI